MSKITKLDLKEYDKLASSGCFVCRIVQGEPLIPGVKIIDEDDFYITFLSQFPTQEGYTLVCPKRHVERFETELSAEEWARLQRKVQEVAKAISEATNAMRMYVAVWGGTKRNAHVHVHVCPCPQGTPPEKEQITAMDGREVYLKIDDARMGEIADSIKTRLARN